MASQILSMSIVLANGTIVEASTSQNKDIFSAGRVGLGSLGVVVELEMSVAPAFKILRTTTGWDLDELVEALPGLNDRFERLQWYWTPNTKNATLLTRVPVANTAKIGHGCWPDAGPGPNTSCVDWSYKALSHPSSFDHTRALYTEMEYFVPTRYAMALVTEFREFQDSIRGDLERLCQSPTCGLFAGIRYVAQALILSTIQYPTSILELSP